MNIGLCATCSSGALIPSAAQINLFLLGGGTVRDVLGWHRVETTPGIYKLPDYAKALYAAVYAAGCQNVVTLGFGNALYGGKPMSFPVEIDAGGTLVRDASGPFAKYAAWAVTNVPNLAAVSIDNEVNGSFDDGSPPVRQEEYAILLRAVVPAIRAANPKVKIIAGATVGFNIDGWFKNLDKLYSLSQVDYLDIHPYLGPAKLSTWARQIASIRKAGILNPAWYTEHGGLVATAMAGAYWKHFGDICAADPVAPAGANYFLLQNTPKFHSGLLDQAGNATALGLSWS